MRKVKSAVKRSARKVISRAAITDKRIMRNFADKVRFVPIDNAELLKDDLQELDKKNFMIFCNSYKKTLREKAYVATRTSAQKLSRPIRKRF